MHKLLFKSIIGQRGMTESERVWRSEAIGLIITQVNTLRKKRK